MDVAQVVNVNGVISALFALLAGIALAVELGRKPGLRRKESQSAGAEPGGKSKKKGKEGAEPEAPQPAREADPFSLAKTVIPVKPFDNVQSTEAGLLDQMGIHMDSSSSLERLSEMQSIYVDGLLCSRNKYDVALAILNEYQEAAAMPENQDSAVLMATQAYLSATRSGRAAAMAAPSAGKPETAKKKSDRKEKGAADSAKKTPAKKRATTDATRKGSPDRKKTVDDK